MSLNKNAQIRYQVLDRCFRNTGRIYFIDDLLEECNKALLNFDSTSKGIQRRQLFDDIRFMESEQGWSIPLIRVRRGKKVSYQYENPIFSISNQTLNDSEVEQLKSAIETISHFSGNPQFEWVNELIPILESKFGLIERKKEVISFDNNIDLKGYNLIMPLFNAIINQRVLEISYRTFKTTEPFEINFHPYYLKQFNNRWFVFGYNQGHDIPIWTLALDRIVSISEIDVRYVETNIDWEDYFYDLIGVTKPKGVEVQEIKLKFSHDAAPYIITKPIHPSQKIEHDEKGLFVKIKVVPNNELESMILSFGDRVKVISPKYLKERVISRLQDANNQYIMETDD